MTLTPLANLQPMTLEDFLEFHSNTEAYYELEDGKLRVLPTESEINRLIASFLFAHFLQLGLPSSQLSIKTEIVVNGHRTTVRLPDLIVLTQESLKALEGSSRSIITLDMVPPRLVIEIVSPGKENQDRDYRYKRSQYQARDIAEYWIVDPIEKKLTILTLVNGLYEDAAFQGVGMIGNNTVVYSLH